MAPRSTPMPAATARCPTNMPTRSKRSCRAKWAKLLAQAEAADRADVPDGMSIPEELGRRQTRLAGIAAAKAKIEARAAERHAA